MTELDAKGAVAIAKRYIKDLFATEGVTKLGLEEIEHDDARGLWLITLGFSRVWGDSILALAGGRRDYKIISITDAGQVISLKNRETTNAE